MHSLSLLLGVSSLLSVGSASLIRGNNDHGLSQVRRSLHVRAGGNYSDFDNSTDGDLNDIPLVEPFIINAQYNLTVLASSDDDLPDANTLNASYNDALKYVSTRMNSSTLNSTLEDPFVWLGQHMQDERMTGFVGSPFGSNNITWSIVHTTLMGLQSFLNANKTSGSNGNLVLGENFILVDRKQNITIAQGYFGNSPSIPPDTNSTSAPSLIKFSPLEDDVQVQYNTSDPAGGPMDPQTMVEQLQDAISSVAIFGDNTIDSSDSEEDDSDTDSIMNTPFSWITHSSVSDNKTFNLLVVPQTPIDAFTVVDILQGLLDNVTSAGYYVGGTFVVVNTTSSSGSQQPLIKGIMSSKPISKSTAASLGLGQFAVGNSTTGASSSASSSSSSSSSSTSSRASSTPASPATSTTTRPASSSTMSARKTG